jgi:hypothetical protein
LKLIFDFASSKIIYQIHIGRTVEKLELSFSPKMRGIIQQKNLISPPTPIDLMITELS